MALRRFSQATPATPGCWVGGEPLWKVVPKRDTQGHALADFMMLAPALKQRTDHEKACAMELIRAVLARFGDAIAFANFNTKINVLWVSLQCRPGLMSQVVAALRQQVPELKLIAHHPDQGESK
jgi:hypothetical protein